MVSERYDKKLSDVSRWFHSTVWAIHGWVSNKMIKSMMYHLELAKIIEKTDLKLMAFGHVRL